MRPVAVAIPQPINTTRTIFIWIIIVLFQLYWVLYLSIHTYDFQIFPVKLHDEPEKNISDEQPTLCLTHGCRTTAKHILENLNVSVNPCEDFYAFACGNFMSDSPIPIYQEYTNTFVQIEDRIFRQVLTLLVEPFANNEPRSFSMAKTMFNTCMNVKKIDGRGSAPLMDVLFRLGGWPALQGNDWLDTNWTLTTYLRKIHGEGFDMEYLFTIGVDRNPKNLNETIIGVAPPNFAISVENLAQGMTDKIVQRYAKYMENAAINLGAIGNNSKTELNELIQFEIALAKINRLKFNLQNVDTSYNPMALNLFQQKYNYFEWMDYLRTTFPFGTNIKKEEPIVVLTPDFFSDLQILLESSKRRTIVNFLIWRVIHDSVPFLSNRDRLEAKQSRRHRHTKQPKWRDCVDMTKKSFPVAVGAMYSRRYYSLSTTKLLSQMVRNISLNFEKSISQFDWMDFTTKSKAIHKLRSLKFIIGQPNEILNTSLVDEFYATLYFNYDTFLESMLTVNRFKHQMQFWSLRKSAVESAWLEFADTSVSNAFYSPNYNTVFIPTGVLQREMFSVDRIDSLNFGAIGTVIGHEIWHALDDLGSQFDESGNMRNWWSSASEVNYHKQTQCFIDKYVTYADSIAGNIINGKQFLRENLADFMGTFVTYKTNELWPKNNRTNLLLPGLDYSADQLLWITMAQNWCFVHNEGFPNKSISSDAHAPDRLRVLGVVRHIPQFSNDFNCGLDTNMNPPLKCKV